jgi:hypothetical protein
LNTKSRATVGKNPRSDSRSRDGFIGATSRAFRHRLSDLWRLLLVFSGMAAVFEGERRRPCSNPYRLCDDEEGRMRCIGNRCAALMGKVGISTTCAIYAVRPDVCKVCLPGDEACQMARRRFNLMLLAPSGWTE